MIWERIRDNWIDRLGYNPYTKQLVAIMRTGRVFIYDNVEWEEWEALRTGESVGQIINRMIAENRR